MDTRQAQPWDLERRLGDSAVTIPEGLPDEFHRRVTAVQQGQLLILGELGKDSFSCVLHGGGPLQNRLDRVAEDAIWHDALVGGLDSDALVVELDELDGSMQLCINIVTVRQWRELSANVCADRKATAKVIHGIPHAYDQRSTGTLTVLRVFLRYSSMTCEEAARRH